MRNTILLMFALLLSPAWLSAAPILWTISSLTFADGGVASGSFVYDAATNTYSNVNITTSGGTLPSRHYITVLAIFAGPTLTIGVTGPAALNAPALALKFSSALTDAGGTRTISGSEGFCLNAACSVVTIGGAGTRAITGGSINGVPFVVVPAAGPATLSAMILGLIACAGLALRTRSV